MLEAQSCSL